jgi:hypothetical protein
VFLLRFESKTGTGHARVSGEWWARGISNYHTDNLPETSLESCDPVPIAIGARLASETALAQLPKAIFHPGPACEPPIPPHRPSAWLAAAFAGAPFLADPNAGLAGKITFTGLDAGLLGGAIYFAGAAVHHKNQQAAGVTASRDRANDDLHLAIYFLGGTIAVRAVAGLVYWLAR